LALHIDFEKVTPWNLKRISVVDKTAKKSGIDPKVHLKAFPKEGAIRIDSATDLNEIPEQAWLYRLGNRSALEWILDQYKESVPKDPTIRDKFDSYSFAKHKEKVIDLLQRVTRISVETMKIVDHMRRIKRT
jgi:predicted helicase